MPSRVPIIFPSKNTSDSATDASTQQISKPVFTFEKFLPDLSAIAFTNASPEFNITFAATDSAIPNPSIAVPHSTSTSRTAYTSAGRCEHRSDVGEKTEQEGQRNLQKLHWLKFAPQYYDLTDYQNTIPDYQPRPGRQRYIFAAHNIRHRRNRRYAELAAFCDSNAQRGEKQTYYKQSSSLLLIKSPPKIYAICRLKVKVVYLTSLPSLAVTLSAQILPLCSVIIFFAIDSPSPAPDLSFPRDLSVL